MPSRSLTIVGAGGHARVVKAMAKECAWHVICVLDDDPERGSEIVSGGGLGPAGGDVSCRPISCLLRLDESTNNVGPAVLAIGNNGARKRIDVQFPGVDWVKLVHPKSVVDETAVVAAGSVVCVGSIINAGARVGRHVIVNTAAVVEHDTIVGDYAHIAPNATICGDAEIKEGAMIGAGSVVLPGRRVGAWSVVGSGTVVTVDVPDKTVSVGVPNRILAATSPARACDHPRVC